MGWVGEAESAHLNTGPVLLGTKIPCQYARQCSNFKIVPSYYVILYYFMHVMWPKCYTCPNKNFWWLLIEWLSNIKTLIALAYFPAYQQWQTEENFTSAWHTYSLGFAFFSDKICFFYCTNEILISDVNSDKNSLAIIYLFIYLVICA